MKPKPSPTKIRKSNNPKTNIDRTAGLPIEMKDYLSELEELRRSINYIRVTTYALQKFNKSCNGIEVLAVNDDTIKKF